MKKIKIILIIMLLASTIILSGCTEQQKRTILIDGETIKIPDHVKGEVYDTRGPSGGWVLMKTSEDEYTRTFDFQADNSPLYREGGIPGYTDYSKTEAGRELMSLSEDRVGDKFLITIAYIDEYYVGNPPPDGETKWRLDFTYNLVENFSYLGLNDEVKTEYREYRDMVDAITNNFMFPAKIVIDHSDSIDKYGSGMYSVKNTGFNLSFDCEYAIQNIRIQIRLNENLGDKFNINLLEFKKGGNYIITTVYGTESGHFQHGIYHFYLDYYIDNWGMGTGITNIGASDIIVYLGVKN